jgi:hypothetical protein
VEMRYKVWNGTEVIFTGVADLPGVAGPEDLVSLKNAARENFQKQYPSVDLADPRLRHEWEKEPTSAP